MIEKLKLRFVMTASLAVLIVLLVVLGLINLMNFRVVYRNCMQVLELIAENDGELSDEVRWSQSGLEDAFGDEAPYRIRYFSVILDADGNVESVITDHINSVDQSEASEYAGSTRTLRRKHGFFSVGGNTYCYLITDQEDGGMLISFLDSTNEMWSVWKFMHYSILFGILTLAGFVLLMFFFANRAVQPTIQNIESQKRFITNAGHELKTPIAVISANTEVLEMMHGENEWTQSILKQTKRLSGLVNDFILLTKVDEMTKPELVEVSLSAAARDTADAFRTVAEQAGKKFETEIADEVRVKATERELPALLNVLVDNAVKYCDDGGTVKVQVTGRSSGKNSAFVVSNDYAAGKGQDFSRFFDRFYRADESHNSEKSGYGIGLSMAEGIARMYRGKIRADWKDGMMYFSVIFP